MLRWLWGGGGSTQFQDVFLFPKFYIVLLSEMIKILVTQKNSFLLLWSGIDPFNTGLFLNSSCFSSQPIEIETIKQSDSLSLNSTA